MSDLEAVEGLDALPRRIFLEGDRRPITDPLDGFVRPIGISVQELLAHTAVLVVAPPLTGKTFVSKQLERALVSEQRSSSALPLRGFCERTSFETSGRTNRLDPVWWEPWKKSAEQAWWLVDALDEDERRGDRRAHEVLDTVRDLPPEALSRLHLILFSRLNEVPAWCEEKLLQLFGIWSQEHPQGLRRVRLAGLDREAARTLVGSERFEHVCMLIRKSRLQSLAPYPSVLEHLRKRSADESLTEEDIWRGVLTDLLHERRGDSLLSPLEQERFKVAQRLAAISSFCGEQALRLDTPGLEDLIPANDPNLGDLRLAAQEVVGKTAIFERSADGFRFAQDHVRQWLTAFALQDMPLLQIRPLLTLESGTLDPSHEGVMSFLAKISKHSEVRDWIFDEHGGLPDPESVPWSLDGAIRALDRLQENARLSPWGLRLWGEERLASFNVEGMGDEIARRFEGALRPTEQQFLFDVAAAIEASEILPAASRLLQDPGRDQRVRAQSADFVASLGCPEHLRSLEQWVLFQAENDSGDGHVLTTLAAAFYEKGLWTFEETADLALAGAGLSHGHLQYRLVEDLTLDRARGLIRKFVVGQPGIVAQHLAERALRMFLDPREPSEEDAELIVSLALRLEDIEDAQDGLGFELARFVEQNLSIRRKLFLEGLKVDPLREGASFRSWAYVLCGEDTEWLLDLIREREGDSEWLWETLFYISGRSECRPYRRRKARAALRSQKPDVLQRLEKERKEWDRYQRSREQKRKSRRTTYRLEPLVHRELNDSERDAGQRMWSLSRLCFMGRGHRPTNLEGRWEELPVDLRRNVFEVCRQALEDCAPTTIPEGASFRSVTLLEAACFDRLVQEDGVFVLTPGMIRKWLPALLRSWESSSEYSITLRRCFQVDRHLSEDVFREAVLRSARTETGSVYILQELPADLWSERFAGMLEEIIQSDSAQTEARIDLLKWTGRVFPGRAHALASGWATGTDQALRDAGIDLLLRISSAEGLERLKALAEQEAPADLLRRMRSLRDHPSNPRADFASWPAGRLGDLEELLLRSFPPETDPKWEGGEGGMLEADDDLRMLRDRLPPLLFQRHGEEDCLVVDRLAYNHPYIREWLTQAQAQEGAQGMLAELGRARGWPGNRKIGLTEMVKVLRDSRYRLLRTTDDLLDVLLEELDLVTKEAKRHLSMLYHPKPRRNERLHEDALQAYLDCRLSDRLPGVLRESGVPFINREPLAAGDTKNDFRVQAFSTDKVHLTVVVEVKWSDNPDVSTSLVTQLGEDYLLRNGLTHGIYLVGWSGATKPWKSTLNPAPEPRSSRDAWQKALDIQAELFCQAHGGLRITPLVMDLAWEPEPG